LQLRKLAEAPDAERIAQVLQLEGVVFMLYPGLHLTAVAEDGKKRYGTLTKVRAQGWGLGFEGGWGEAGDVRRRDESMRGRELSSRYTVYCCTVL
jgi:hypothetical protein